MTPEDLDYVRDLLRRQAAFVVDKEKDYLIEARLGPLAALLGYPGASEMIGAVRDGRALDLKQKIVEAMDIHETSFFRDWKPFEALRTGVLPRLVAARSRSRELVLWSAACSNGQEPYSLAMLLREHFPELAGWRVRILASDISGEALARARAGRYSTLEVNRGLPAALSVKYLERSGLDWVVRDELREAITFLPLNLASPWPALPSIDVVLLRNVLIYFDLESRRQVLARVAEVLQPDGVLVMGATETTFGLSEIFGTSGHGGCCYGRRPQGRGAHGA